MHNPKLVSAVLFEFNRGFNQKKSKEDLMFYARMLDEYSAEEVTRALKRIMRNGSSFFPSVPEILKELSQSVSRETKAEQMSGKVIDTVLRFGRYQEDEIRESLSEQEYQALKQIGGIEQICNITQDRLSFVSSRLSKACKAIVETGNVDSYQKIENKKPQGKLLKLSEGFGGYLK
ncbi:MAG: hypothetical protein Unbinned5081contig1003_30 [Prokaryotic dsDNA virus sp.]|nr:MAG: hypothetical protein Unbinned5081contig1003_30 [Prokaryotic dsDNA virus sp.]|tara:strand:- start:475 stop:1002 length:528 start_codon:yes stop_codon:yes gene_type:complete